MLERLSSALHLLDLLSIWSILDILILAAVIYQLLLLLRGTRAVQILAGLTFLVMLWLLTGAGLIPLPALHRVLGSLLLYLPLVIIVLFQNQIRQALAQVGRNPLNALMPRRKRTDTVDIVSLAAVSLAGKRLGGLIVFEREMGLRHFSETGIRLDASISYDLLMNIFVKDSPLHDGAVIIAEGRLMAASCFLPLTTDPGLSRSYGTRHRAAIGITEESDAVAVTVSEERRTISIVVGGQIEEGLDGKQLKDRLRTHLQHGTDA
jgi:diadenylate cyclase